MSVNSIGNNSPVQKILTNPVRKDLSAKPVETSSSTRTDKVELSSTTPTIATPRAGESFRADKVAEMRAKLASGTYSDTDYKLNVAADKMLDDVMKGL